MVQQVVFDLGGVVFRWQPVVLLQQVLPERAPDDARAAALAAQIFQTFHPDSDWALFDLGRIEPDALARRIAARTGLSEDELHRVIQSIPPHLTAQPGTVDVIRRLHARGVPVYFLSNMPAPYADHLEQAHTVFECFRDGVFSARVGQIKPERPIFETANQRFGVAGPQTLFIDDVRHNIDAAEAHGWSGLHFTDPTQCQAALEALGLLPAA